MKFGFVIYFLYICIMRNLNWNLLKAEDIEVRQAGKIEGSSKVKMLLYQDARCTVKALDEQFGAFNWTIDYKVVGEQIYGRLSVWDEERKMFIHKEDTGDKSNIAEDKGQSSDILKRCAVRWGYATELYTAPTIKVDDDGYGNKNYKVSEIDYDANRCIKHLVIVNRFGKEVFRWDKSKTQTQSTPYKPINHTQDDLEWVDEKEVQKPIKKDNATILTEFCNEKKNDSSTNTKELDRFYGFYKDKTNNWRGTFDVNRLYDNWMSKLKTA